MHIETEFLNHKVQLTKRVMFFMGIVVCIMILIRLMEHNYIQATADSLFIGILFYGHHKLTQDPNHLLAVAKLSLISAFSVVLLLVIKNADILMGFLWFTSIIYLTFYYLKKKEAWLWFAIMLAILIVTFSYFSERLMLDWKSFFIWISNILFIIVIMSLYEQIKEDAEQEIIKHQERLTIEIDEKTKELQSLNSNLETRITEEVAKNQKQQQELIEKSKHVYIGEMISMLAHQWRQPLTAITSSVNTLKLQNMLGKYEPEYFDERLTRIASYSHELSQTINDFRDFFQTTNHKESSSFEEMSDGVLSIIFPLLESKSIKLQKEYKANQDLFTYTNEVKQVILALIQNTIDAMKQNTITHPLIIIRTYQKEESLFLEIEDNAGGIPLDIIEHIFSPYFSTKSAKNETGLGLYMAKTIIEDHCQGHLKVSNTKEGACFSIEIPQ